MTITKEQLIKLGLADENVELKDHSEYVQARAMLIKEFEKLAGAKSAVSEPVKPAAYILTKDLNKLINEPIAGARNIYLYGSNQLGTVPLYTTTSAESKREPLTHDKIWEIWHGQPKDGAITVTQFARAIEKAHNIGAKE